MAIERAAATADDTLNQTSDTLVDGLTLTPASGDYLLYSLVAFQTPSSASNSRIHNFTVYVGGTLVDHSERQFDQDSSVTHAYRGVMLSCKVSPNGSQAVEIRCRANSTSNGLVAKKRELNLFPINGTDVEVSATTDATLATATWTDLLTMTTPASGDYLLTFSTTAEGPSGAELAFRVTVGGTAVDYSVRQEEQESSGSVDHFSIGTAVHVTPNGSQDVVIQWRRQQGSGTIRVSERTMNLIPTAAGDIFQATGTADDADSTTTDKQLDDMLIADPGADDYLVIYTGSEFVGSASDDEITYSIEEGGAKVPDSERTWEHEGSIDNVNLFSACGGRVTVAGGTDDIQIFWQSSRTQTRTARERTLIALREAAGGQSFTLVVDAGAYTFAGTAATLLYHHALDVVSGAYVESGTAALTEYHRVFSAATEAYSHTGTAASLEIGYAVTAVAGSFAHTGTAASVLYHRVFPAATTSYLDTGTAANLEVGYVVSAASAAYAETGAAATFRVDYAVDPTPGVYTQTGTAAMLEYHRVVAAAPAAYVWTGTAVTLIKGFTFAVGPGTYTAVGTTATLEYHHVFAAATAAHAWTGTAAILTKHFSVAVESGAYIETGTAASLLRQAQIAATTDSYSLTGTAASTEHHRVVAAATAVYAVVGTAATLSVGADVTLVVDAGIYSLSGTAANPEYHRIVGVAPTTHSWTGTPAAFVYVPFEMLDEGFTFSLSRTAAVTTAVGRTAAHTLPISRTMTHPLAVSRAAALTGILDRSSDHVFAVE